MGEELNNRVPNPFSGLIASGPLSGSTVPQHHLMRLYPQFNNVNQPRSANGATARFDALYFKFTRRVSKGLTILTSYQWAKA